MKIGENLSNSISFTHEALFGRWVRWIMLIISSFIFPIMYGYTVRIMRGIEPEYEEESFFSLFIDGLKLLVIYILYMIVPLIIFGVTIVFAIFQGVSSGEEFSIYSLLPFAGALIGGILISAVTAFIFTLLCIVGSVRFARTGRMGEAFAFGEIIATIGRIGWINYIVSLIALVVVIFLIIVVITLIEVIFGFIPIIGGIIGMIIGWILSLFLGPYISILSSRYYSLLYDEGA